MKIIEKGDSEIEYSVVACVHGDEPCGKRAIEKLLEDFEEFNQGVKFIIANEKALERSKRYVDVDLNRSFPGYKESESHEERLAAEIIHEVSGTMVLDLHSTRSNPVPFITLSEVNQTTLELMRSTGVETACVFEEDVGAMSEHVEGIIVESGPQGSEEAFNMCYRILKNYLSAEGVIDAESKKSDPEVFRYFETVNGAGWEFLAENFRKVEKGEVFAERKSTEFVSKREFYPVLMSTDGYDDILGHKAEKIGRASELEGR